MGTLADKLNYLKETKKQIKTALQEKGIEVLDTEPFRSYPNKISGLSSGFENATDVISYGTEYNGTNPKQHSFVFPAGYKTAFLDIVILSANANTIGAVEITGTDLTVTEKLSAYLGKKINGQVTVYTNRRSYLLERIDASQDLTINTSIKASEMRGIYGTLIY